MELAPTDRTSRLTGPQRRTESDYVGALADAVTLDDWRQIANKAKQLAKDGDAQARNWLSQHLMGKPQGSAPPLAVVVAQCGDQGPAALPRRRRLARDFDESDGES
jgi:hypothetical protein